MRKLMLECWYHRAKSRACVIALSKHHENSGPIVSSAATLIDFLMERQVRMGFRQ